MNYTTACFPKPARDPPVQVRLRPLNKQNKENRNRTVSANGIETLFLPRWILCNFRQMCYV